MSKIKSNLWNFYRLRRSKTPDRQRGQSLLELALFFPALLFLMVGMLDLGRAFHLYTTLVNAAREGARYAALNPSDVIGIRASVESEATGSNVDLTSGTTISIETPSGVGSGNPIKITVTKQFQMVTGLLDSDHQLSVSGVASMPQF